MRWVSFSAFAALLCVGLNSNFCFAEAPSKPVGRKWGEPIDWANDPPKTSPVDFEKMVFAKPELKERVDRWTNLARRNSMGYFYLPWNEGYAQRSVQWWSNTPQYVTAWGKVEGGEFSKPGEVHVVRLELNGNKGRLRPEFVLLRANWKPEKPGWAGSVYVASSGGDSGHTMITCTPIGVERTKQVFQVFPHMSRWEYKTTYDEINYTFEVSPEELKGAVSATLSLKELASWFANAETFRAVGLKRLDVLEASIRKQMATGDAIASVTRTIVEGGDRSDNPPQRFEEDATRELLAAERDEVLATALENVADRRAIFAAHSDEMYESILKVFPLDRLGE